MDIVDALSYNFKKTYYKCPSFGSQVWSFGFFEGNICWNCPGTLLHGFVKMTPVIGQIERMNSGTFWQKTTNSYKDSVFHWRNGCCRERNRKVLVCSRMVKAFSVLQAIKTSGVHHYLLASGISRKWAVFERLEDGV